MTAVDQRPPIKNPIKAKRGTAEAPWEDVAGFKELLIRELQGESSAMLLDPHYAYPRGITMLDARLGLILTLEDSIFRETPGGRLSSEIDDWSVEKIKRAGGDAVKVLTWYRPDGDPGVCAAQQSFTQRVGEACRKFDIPFVFELLVYPLVRDAEQTRDYVEMQTKQSQLVIDSVRAFADARFGVDLFKLESPVPRRRSLSRARRARMPCRRFSTSSTERPAGRGSCCRRRRHGRVQARAALRVRGRRLGYSRRPRDLAQGIPALPDWDGIREELRAEAVPYMRSLNSLTDASARPWHTHPCYGPGGARVEPCRFQLPARVRRFRRMTCR